MFVIEEIKDENQKKSCPSRFEGFVEWFGIQALKAYEDYDTASLERCAYQESDLTSL